MSPVETDLVINGIKTKIAQVFKYMCSIIENDGAFPMELDKKNIRKNIGILNTTL